MEGEGKKRRLNPTMGGSRGEETPGGSSVGWTDAYKLLTLSNMQVLQYGLNLLASTKAKAGFPSPRQWKTK